MTVLDFAVEERANYHWLWGISLQLIGIATLGVLKGGAHIKERMVNDTEHRGSLHVKSSDTIGNYKEMSKDCDRMDKKPPGLVSQTRTHKHTQTYTHRHQCGQHYMHAAR